MHNNYHFFRHLSKALLSRIHGTVVSECFSQNKDELIIRFETQTKPFFIKAALEPAFSCLSFPDNFQRARKNSVDLFGELIGRRVSDVHIFRNERSFSVIFDEKLQLLFKMHGNRANLILFEDESVMSLFRNNMVADASLSLDTLDREIDWSFNQLVARQHELSATYFTFGKIPWRYLREHDFDQKPVEEKWIMINSVLQQLDEPTFYTTITQGDLVFSLLPVGQIQDTFNDPLHAITSFYYSYTQQHAYGGEKNDLLSTLHSRLKSSTAYYDKTASRIMEIREDTNYKTWADLIMANLHTIYTGTEKVVLENFYNENQPTEIKLKRDLSPQKNAEVFYRKSKNQQGELQRLQKQADAALNELTKTQLEIEKVEAASDLKSIRSLRSSLGIDHDHEKKQAPLPYRETEFHGFRILIGKNAQSNDMLTLRYGYKEDLWLHAKDVSGSHVLLKHQAGKKFPKDVIERAAQLAAFFSKRKNESLCPVIITPKKYVRKRKGDPAGMVVVEREEVILVEPAGL